MRVTKGGEESRRTIARIYLQNHDRSRAEDEIRTRKINIMPHDGMTVQSHDRIGITFPVILPPYTNRLTDAPHMWILVTHVNYQKYDNR